MSAQLIPFNRTARPQVRLVCFPYAGGSAAFMRFMIDHVDERTEVIGVEYPNRAQNISHHQSSDVQSVAADLTALLGALTDAPLILFGYSLGALIAYECTHLLAHGGRARVAELLAAACAAPHLSRTRAGISQLPEDQFIARLRDYGGTPESFLNDREVMRHFLPVLRSDFALAEKYRCAHEQPLACPITIIGAADDPLTSTQSLTEWHRHTRAHFTLRLVQGGHFFLHHDPRAISAPVLQSVQQHRNR